MKKVFKKLFRPKFPFPIFSGIQKVELKTSAHKKWSQYYETKSLTIEKNPIFSKNDRIFTIGSCFAERIRIALSEKGFTVGPDYKSIPIEVDRFKIDTLPHRPHMNYYNTFAIRQEMERHIGEWSQSKDDIWISKDKFWGGKHAYQDPYRRLVFGKTPEDLLSAIERINNTIKDGLKNSDVFFITFGMAEVFKKKDNGLIACQKPAYGGGAGLKETNYHLSSFEENRANIEKTINIIKHFNKDARIVLTVSPVPLERSFSGKDIVVANIEGKSILRAAAGQVAREQNNVFYYPSYEIVTSNGQNGFIPEDGRHVNDEIVNIIVDGFLKAHCKDY